MKDTKEEKGMEVTLFPQKKRISNPVSSITLPEALLSSIGILVARATLLPGLAPFGLAFLAMERKFSFRSLMTLLMVVVGYASLGSWASLRYIAASVVFAAGLLFLERGRELSLGGAIALGSGSILVMDAVFILWDGFSIGNLLLLLFDLSLVALGVLAFDHCRSLSSENFRKETPTGEEKLSLYVLSAVTLLSFQSLSFGDWFSVANALGFLLLGTIAISGGLQSSMIAGFAIGFLLGFQTDLLACLSIFGVCGLVCGLFWQAQRQWVAGSLALSGLLLSSYAYGSGIPAVHFTEAPIAGLLLFFLPLSVFRKIRPFTQFQAPDSQGSNPYKTHVQSKLSLVADSFHTLSETFVRISDREEKTNTQEIAALFDTAAEHVCRSCSRMQDCWNRNFHDTYTAVFQLLEKLERKGKVESEDAAPYLADRCLRLPSLTREVNRLYELHQINQVWKCKLSENRMLAGEQFSGVAEILTRLRDDLDYDIAPDQLAAQELRCRLESSGIPVQDIQVTDAPAGRQTVRLTVEDGIEPDRILPTLKSVLGKNFTLSGSLDMPVLQFREAPEFTIDAAFASTGLDGESGDSLLFHPLHNGKYLATLSDGMGTGQRANRESSATITLLEAFMDAGFDKTVAVKLINSIMVMKSAGEAFATVDMCMIDLYTGEAEFIKNGAEPSYIKREQTTETVRAASLPLGVLSGVEAETFAHRLAAGDTIVMVSDGLELRESGETWIRRALEEFPEDISTQELADRIMQRSVELKGGVADDDMTILVLRFLKTA